MRRIVTVLAVAALVPSGLAYADTVPATTTLASVTAGGTPANASARPAITPDGRYVAFDSSSPAIVAGDTNRSSDVFVRDRQTGVTTRVSVDSNGAEANNSSWSPSISADGRYVVFLSHATNLVSGDTNGYEDVFLHDLLTGATTRVNIGWRGDQADSQSWDPVISADGKFIAYASYASDLVMNDTNGVHDIFEYDREQNYTIRVSVDSNGMQANDLSYRPRISGDGRYVTFESNASNLALGVDNSRAQDVFVHDRLFGSTHLVSANIDGIGGNSSSRYAAISADGRYIVFNSYASNLVPGDTNNRSDMFVSDRLTNTITRIDVLPNGGQLAEGTTPDVYPSISADGRYVAFESGDDTMVPGDLNHEWDVFVRDRVAGTTTLASVATDGTQGDRGASSPAISGDGRHVAFAAYAHNWVDTGLPDYVISANIYVRDLEGQ